MSDLRKKKNHKLASVCVVGGREEDGPDMPSIDSADSLKEQYYWFMLGINNPPEKDNIDWEGLEKELRAYADEVSKEWFQRKRAEDRAEAIRAGRL